jgi:N-acetylmuramoyl-L-alanine amidase
MHKQWFGCCADNFKSGRGGLKPEAIVIHRSGGRLTELDARCKKPRAFSSAHYGVGPAGEVHQYVDERDTAFHAGIVVNPTANIVNAKTGINPNLYTIANRRPGSRAKPYRTHSTRPRPLLFATLPAPGKSTSTLIISFCTARFDRAGSVLARDSIATVF